MLGNAARFYDIAAARSRTTNADVRGIVGEGAGVSLADERRCSVGSHEGHIIVAKHLQVLSGEGMISKT